jgi:hypothetical protein
VKYLAVFVRVIDLFAKPPLQDRQPRRGRVVLAHADPRMVAVAMGDDRARHRPPRIDVEIARRAIQAFGAQDDEVWHRAKMGADVCRPSDE